MTPLETIERDGFTLRMHLDTDAQPPDWDEPLESELQAWRDGEVYGYTITDAFGQEVDSCWGFYGWEHALGSATEQLDYFVTTAHAARVNLYRALVNESAS